MSSRDFVELMHRGSKNSLKVFQCPISSKRVSLFDEKNESGDWTSRANVCWNHDRSQKTNLVLIEIFYDVCRQLADELLLHSLNLTPSEIHNFRMIYRAYKKILLSRCQIKSSYSFYLPITHLCLEYFSHRSNSWLLNNCLNS